MNDDEIVKFLVKCQFSSPTLTLWWAYGLLRILQIPLFKNPKGRSLKVYYESSSLASEPGFQSLWGPRPEHVFAAGSTTTCEHSQELTPGLLELKVAQVYLRHWCHLRLFSFVTATSDGGPSRATVPPGDRFLSLVPVPIRICSLTHSPRQAGKLQMRLDRSTLVYRLELFFSLLSIWVPGRHKSQVMSLCILPQRWYVTPPYLVL